MRARLTLLAVALLLSESAYSLDLRWSNGADTLSFAEARRCTLVLGSGTGAPLPTAWHLLWQADTAGVHILCEDSSDVCTQETARVTTLHPPATRSDSLAYLTTAELCSGGERMPATAYYVLDQPGGSRGRLKVVALDPLDPDSSRVLHSNEVTYNGGTSGGYTPAVLRATSRREGSLLRVDAIGSDLGAVHAMRLGAADHLWSVALAVAERSDSSVSAAAHVHVPLPQAVVQAGSEAAMSGPLPIPADNFDGGAQFMSAPDTVLYVDPEHSLGWYPKDFAFVYNTYFDAADPLTPWKGLFHLFYLRAKYNATGSDTAIAHAWSQNLVDWDVDLHAFGPSHDGGWDASAVWAPSVIQVGDLYCMFYTGVDEDDHQRIGYVTASELPPDTILWSGRALAHEAQNTGWADPDGLFLNRQGFRDPWVLPDPDSLGRYLLFNVGEDLNYVPNGYTVVGVARNRPGTLTSWADLGSYRATDYSHTSVTQVESPLVIRDSSGTGAWRIYFANGPWNLPGHNSTYLVTSLQGTAVTDTTPDNWPQIETLYDYLGGNSNVVYWQATEHVQVGHLHLFAAFNGAGIGITRMIWNGSDFTISNPLSVEREGSGDGTRFYLSGFAPAGRAVTFVVESPARVTPKVSIYDVAGRRCRTLGRERAIQGRAELTWDLRDGRGVVVPSGVYFARLTGAGVARVLRLPVVR